MTSLHSLRRSVHRTAILLLLLGVSDVASGQGIIRRITLANRTMLSAVTTGSEIEAFDDTTTTSESLPESCTSTIDWGAGTTDGTVAIDSAPTATYAGAWTRHIAVEWAAASTTDTVVSTPGPYGAIKHIVTEDIVGGTVTTHLQCH